MPQPEEAGSAAKYLTAGRFPTPPVWSTILNLDMRDFVLPIRRTTPLYKLVDPEEEFAIMPPSMQAYLVDGQGLL